MTIERPCSRRCLDMEQHNRLKTYETLWNQIYKAYLWLPWNSTMHYSKMESKCNVNVNVNWYFSKMEPSRKSHAIKLSLFMWCYVKWCHLKCLATHNFRLQPSSICMNKLQPWWTAALVPKFRGVYPPLSGGSQPPPRSQPPPPPRSQPSPPRPRWFTLGIMPHIY